MAHAVGWDLASSPCAQIARATAPLQAAEVRQQSAIWRRSATWWSTFRPTLARVRPLPWRAVAECRLSRAQLDLRLPLEHSLETLLGRLRCSTRPT